MDYDATTAETLEAMFLGIRKTIAECDEWQFRVEFGSRWFMHPRLGLVLESDGTRTLTITTQKILPVGHGLSEADRASLDATGWVAPRTR